MPSSQGDFNKQIELYFRNETPRKILTLLIVLNFCLFAFTLRMIQTHQDCGLFAIVFHWTFLVAYVIEIFSNLSFYSLLTAKDSFQLNRVDVQHYLWCFVPVLQSSICLMYMCITATTDVLVFFEQVNQPFQSCLLTNVIVLLFVAHIIITYGTCVLFLVYIHRFIEKINKIS